MSTNKTTDNETCIFVLPHKIQKKRLEIMLSQAKKKSFTIADTFSDNVSHVVTEYEDLEPVIKALSCSKDKLENVTIVKLQWLTDCLKAGQLIDASNEHKIKRTHVKQETPSTGEASDNVSSVPQFACFFATPLHHPNEKYTKALQVLEDNADYESEYMRALAFRKAICSLASAPAPIRNMSDLNKLINLGEHSKRVVQEILEEGFCREVEEIKSSEKFQAQQMFNAIYGVGPVTAQKWIREGLRSVADAKRHYKQTERADERLAFGIAFYDDLNLPLLKSEADVFYSIVEQEAQSILPGVILQMVGGFRRGKDQGHDMDILLTHKEEGKEVGLLVEIVKRLKARGFVLQGHHERSSNFNVDDDGFLTEKAASMQSTMDHLEKWLAIVKFDATWRKKANVHDSAKVDDNDGCSPSKIPRLSVGDISFENDYRESNTDIDHLSALANSQRPWLARRVDLIVAPYSQYAYALVGWTGSRQFNRSIRLYAEKRLGMKLSSQALYDRRKRCAIPAASEEEVFRILGVPYREPHLRNC